MVSMFVVSSTLSLSINARRREFALLRAIGATTRQVHVMIGREVLLVAATAAAIGAVPGFLLARFLGAQFADAGVMPTDFALAYSPLPAIAAFLICVLTARAQRRSRHDDRQSSTPSKRFANPKAARRN